MSCHGTAAQFGVGISIVFRRAVSASFPLALLGREGLRGTIGVEKIGEIRRAYFEQHRSIKEMVRTLSVSRATVRKVAR
jgi:predicted transcriptional regulator